MMESSETNETTAIEQSTESKAEVTQSAAQPEQADGHTAMLPDTTESKATQDSEAGATEAETGEAPAANIYKTKEEVVARAQQIVQSGEASDRQELDLLKQLFYKYHNAEAQKAREEHFAAGGTEETFMPPVDAQEPVFRAAMQAIRERRAALLQEQEQQKKKNLERKQQILARIQQLASTPEEANQAYDEMKALQAEWKEIKAVPAEQATELWKNYQLYVEQFYDLLKLGHELRDYDFKKNLEIKTRLCEQAEALADVPDVIQAFNQLQKLHQEWKETGPVAKELREELWARFKNASTVVNKRHQAHFEAIKQAEEENLAKKTALCEQLEAEHTEGLKTFADWDAVTQRIIALQAEWKKIGFAPQKVNAQIFERFRKGCDAFFEQKARFFRQLKEELNSNLAKKKELVEQAEALAGSTDWRSTNDILVNLQRQWKEIGSVPHKYSDALWKRFVGACDQFFEAKKKANAEAHGEEKANMERKQGIIDALRELAAKEGEDIMQQVKELQQQWNSVGHVPFREKDRLYKEYREVCDKIYGAFSANQRQRRMNNFRTSLAQKIEKGESTVDTERQRMARAYERMQEELKTYENNLCFLTSNSKKGNSLVELAKKKADKLREELNLLAQKIKAVDEQIAQGGKEGQAE
ncbi:MAG TPA: DUF349 domain-containing protein [Prevotellaceae bacterium]|nr:DUF349 domain-containing protein [Prevotellaceae bacterium]